jgi:hypothetical protein
MYGFSKGLKMITDRAEDVVSLGCWATSLLKGICPARFNRGQNQTHKIRTDKRCCRQCFNFNFKVTPQREKWKPVSASYQQLNWTCRVSSQNPVNDGLRTMNWEISLIPADDLTVQHLYRTIISWQISRDKWVQSMYSMILHCTIILRFRYHTHTVISQCRWDFISQILARSSNLVSRTSKFVACIS